MENETALARTNNGNTVFDLLKSDNIKKRFTESTGKNLAAFASAVTEIVNGNTLLKRCEPNSILSAVMRVAFLDLQINPSFGEVYIVPIKGKATVQISYRGFVQLALRSGLYKNIHAGAIHEGEIRGINPLTGEPNVGEKTSDEIVGYVAHFELVNGFVKTLYMTLAEIEEHAQKYSQSYSYDLKNGSKNSIWSTNFDVMAQKTVLKKLLKNWGVKSVEMQQALQFDSKIVQENNLQEEIDITPDDDVLSDIPADDDEFFEKQA